MDYAWKCWPLPGFGRMIQTSLEYGLCSLDAEAWFMLRKFEQYRQDLARLFLLYLFTDMDYICSWQTRHGHGIIGFLWLMDFLDYPEHIFLQLARYVLGGKLVDTLFGKSCHIEYLDSITLGYGEHRQKTGSDLVEVASRTKKGTKLQLDDLFWAQKQKLRSIAP